MQRKLLQEFASDIDIERFLSESPILGAKSGRVGHKMPLLSKELERYCYDHIHKLAIVYEAALTSRMENEVGFFHVMDALNVPRSEQEKMLSTIQYSSEMQSIPYHKLSPVNQFIMAVSPYIWYCLETHPPGTMTPEEVDRITNDIEFTRYINQLAKKISQQVKGALWKPGAGCLGKATLILFAGIIIPLVVFLLFKILF